MYGVFVTFTYPTPTYGAPSPWGYANFYNETEFYTNEVMTSSFAFGLDMYYYDTGTDFQPYWVDYTAGYDLHKIGDPMTESDGRLHSFMAIPHCDTCTSWDIFYDFEFVGTTSNQPNQSSHHLMTGWTLMDMYGPVGLSQTNNRIMYLNGNYQFQRFNLSNTSTRVANGNCEPGANPDYCWRFDTGITTEPSTSGEYVVSWDVSKPIVQPGQADAMVQPDEATTLAAAADELERKAQQFVDARLGGRR